MYVDVAYQAIVRQNRRCFDSAAMKENRLTKIDCLIRQQESNYEDCLQMDCKLLVKNHLLVKSLVGAIAAVENKLVVDVAFLPRATRHE